MPDLTASWPMPALDTEIGLLSGVMSGELVEALPDLITSGPVPALDTAIGLLSKVVSGEFVGTLPDAGPGAEAGLGLGVLNLLRRNGISSNSHINVLLLKAIYLMEIAVDMRLYFR